MKLLDHIYNFLIVGPSGTGKTTFICAYAEKHHKKLGSEAYWLTFPSIQKYLDKLLPSWIHTTTDLLDEAFAGASDNPKRKFVIGDEMNRLISKYDHAKQEGRTFVDLISIHRHKAFDFVASDQVFDFLRGVRNRAHWVIFTGMNDLIYYAMKDNLSPRLMYWVEQYQQELVELGEENRESIPLGKGTVVITNGIKSYVLDFKRPKWFTLELSTIWKNVTPQDLRKENTLKDDIVDYLLDDEYHKALTLAFHLSSKLFSGKITKEKLTAAFVPASMVVYGSPKRLPDSGRGAPELVIATHRFSCHWCKHKDEYKAALGKILSMSELEKIEDPEIDKLESEMVEKLGGVS